MKGFKLPDWMRPYAGKVIGGALTVGLAAVSSKIPLINHFIAPDAVNQATTVIVTWLFATSFTTGANASGINKSNASTPSLAGAVPAVVVPSNTSPAIVDHPAEVLNVGPTYTPVAGDKI